MKRLLFSLLILPILASSAIFEIIGACSKEALFKAEIETKEGQNVGSVTLKVLDNHSIPYLGNERGIHSIFETPIGKDAIEILSDNEMRAFGWCYSVDGIEPGSYPDQALVSSKTAHISWYFGFAHYLNGEWIAQCTKSFTVAPDFLCQ